MVIEISCTEKKQGIAGFAKTAARENK